jgi:hypothetical protein
MKRIRATVEITRRTSVEFEVNGIKLSPKQRRNREVVEL